MSKGIFLLASISVVLMLTSGMALAITIVDCSADPAEECMGTPGFDRISGSDTRDVIDALSADDRVFAGGGADDVFGGSGHDFLRGDAGGDEMHGGDATDTIRAGSGTDQIYGDAQDDTLDGGGGRDTIHGGSSSLRISQDHIYGGNHADTLYGERGRDQIFGDGSDPFSNFEGPYIPGPDIIRGGAGDDWLAGNGGKNSVRGDSGDDYVFGGEGEDRIFGGEGEDVLTASGEGTVYMDAVDEALDHILCSETAIETVEVDAADDFKDPIFTDRPDTREHCDTVNVH